MKYRSILFLFAAIVLAAAAPIQDDSQEALLQKALENTENERVNIASTRLHSSNRPFYTDISTDKLMAAAESNGAKDLFLDLAGTVLDFARRKAGNSRSTDPSKMQNMFRDTYKAHQQRFIPSDVLGDYIRDNEQQETAEIEALSSILQLLGKFMPSTVTTGSGGTGDSVSGLVNLLFQFLQQLLETNWNGGGRRLDVSNQETTGLSEEAEIEELSSLLGNVLQFLGNFGPSSGTSTGGNDGTGGNFSGLMNILLRILGLLRGNANGGGSNMDQRYQVEMEGFDLDNDQEEETAAEIEGFRSFLSNTLKLADRKLKPSSRTPEEDRDAVNNPTKWTDLGRNLLRVLQDKVERGEGERRSDGGEKTAEGETFDRHGTFGN